MTIRPRSILARTALLAAAFLVALTLSAQTLARPGWVGSGLTAQTWFKHAIFYEIETRTFSDSNADGIGDLKGITQRLDYIHSLGVDAILLRSLTPAQSESQPTTIDPALGTLPDFDDLTLQASRVNIRILLELSTPDSALARFWLTRGVAGFYVPGSHASVEAIRKLLPSFVGQRILITDADLTAATADSKPSPNDLILYRATLKSAPDLVPDLRSALDQSQTLLRRGVPVLAITGSFAGAPNSRVARILATAVLLNRSAALISAGQELGFPASAASTTLIPWGQSASAPTGDASESAKPIAPVVATPGKYAPYVPYVRPTAPKKALPPDPSTAAGQETDPKSLLNFYTALGRLHHGTTALRDGEQMTFNHDDSSALIWMRKPASPSQFNPAILIACNLSDKSVVLSLKADVARLQLRGSFLRTILRSDDLMGGISLDPITLPPFGVYIGELRY